MAVTRPASRGWITLVLNEATAEPGADTTMSKSAQTLQPTTITRLRAMVPAIARAKGAGGVVWTCSSVGQKASASPPSKTLRPQSRQPGWSC